MTQKTKYMHIVNAKEEQTLHWVNGHHAEVLHIEREIEICKKPLENYL